MSQMDEAVRVLMNFLPPVVAPIAARAVLDAIGPVAGLTATEAQALITAAEGGYLNLDNPAPALSAIEKIETGQ
jgi:hypothetical protein